MTTHCCAEQVSQTKDDGLKRMADNEISLQQAHQRQLSDVVSEHNRQLGMYIHRLIYTYTDLYIHRLIYT